MTNLGRHPSASQTPASRIVMGAWAEIESLSHSPLRLLSGSRASTAARSVDFVYSFHGDHAFSDIIPCTAALTSLLKRGVLVPNHGRVWAQLRGVVTSSNGIVYDREMLTRAFKDVTLCMPAHWQVRLENTDRSTAIVDLDGQVTQRIKRAGVHMFGEVVRVVIMGDSPLFE